MNSWTVFVKTFMDPVKAFEAIKAKPVIALAMTVMLLMSGAAAFVFATHMDEKAMRAMMVERIEKSGQKMSDEQVDKIIATQSKFMPFAAVTGVIGAAIVYLLVALVFFLLFKLLDADFSFKHSLSVTVHGFLPGLISGLLAIAMVFKTGSVDPKDPAGMVYSNLGFLADPGTQKALHAFLGSIDIFSIWSAVLLTLGYAAISGRSAKNTAPWVCGLWALYVLGKMGLSLVIPS
jgi:hypothetical protein